MAQTTMFFAPADLCPRFCLASDAWNSLNKALLVGIRGAVFCLRKFIKPVARCCRTALKRGSMGRAGRQLVLPSDAELGEVPVQGT